MPAFPCQKPVGTLSIGNPDIFWRVEGLLGWQPVFRAVRAASEGAGLERVLLCGCSGLHRGFSLTEQSKRLRMQAGLALPSSSRRPRHGHGLRVLQVRHDDGRNRQHEAAQYLLGVVVYP